MAIYGKRKISKWGYSRGSSYKKVYLWMSYTEESVEDIHKYTYLNMKSLSNTPT